MSERITLINRIRRRLGRSYVTYNPDHKMPDRFKELAQYNTEVHRGIVHTPETDTRMALLQAEFREWSAQSRGARQ